MLSIPDMALLGAAALLLFGPEQLPRVARKAGNVMREIQNTSSSFIREMERAADFADAPAPRPSVYEPVTPYEPPAPDPAPYDVLHEPEPDEPAADALADEVHADGPIVPETAVGERLAEPREALERAENEGLHASEPRLDAAEPVPERDHTPHV
jgi:sec-independent protein translocase protein TatA